MIASGKTLKKTPIVNKHQNSDIQLLFLLSHEHRMFLVSK